MATRRAGLEGVGFRWRADECDWVRQGEVKVDGRAVMESVARGVKLQGVLTTSVLADSEWVETNCSPAMRRYLALVEPFSSAMRVGADQTFTDGELSWLMRRQAGEWGGEETVPVRCLLCEALMDVAHPGKCAGRGLARANIVRRHDAIKEELTRIALEAGLPAVVEGGTYVDGKRQFGRWDIKFVMEGRAQLVDVRVVGMNVGLLDVLEQGGEKLDGWVQGAESTKLARLSTLAQAAKERGELRGQLRLWPAVFTEMGQPGRRAAELMKKLVAMVAACALGDKEGLVELVKHRLKRMAVATVRYSAAQEAGWHVEVARREPSAARALEHCRIRDSVYYAAKNKVWRGQSGNVDGSRGVTGGGRSIAGRSGRRGSAGGRVRRH